MSTDPTVIYSAASTQQAYLLKGLLEERGIRARVVNDALQIAGGDLPLGWASAARVVVAEDDAAEARRIAVEFDQRTAHETSSDEALEDLSPEDWSDWPACPHCSQKRAARCPICGLSGTEFLLADVQESEDYRRVLLVCPSCDDHVLPEWCARCHHCGHDFGEGWQAAALATAPRIEWNGRTLAVLAVLFAGVGVLGGYFYLLFSRR